jgi:iron complex outermembrane recepter protein
VKKGLPWLILLAFISPVEALENPLPFQLAMGDLTSLSLEQLSQIEVTSVSKSLEKFTKAAAAIFVISQDDIRRSGATSIPEALRLAPGIDVERINSNQWSIGVRGFGDRLARSVLVLIDGRAVYSPLYGGTYWEIQDYPLEDIDRIEVIRGPGGSLWGANAVNGVINIISKSAKDTQGTLLTAGGGTEERAFGGARYGGKVGDHVNYRVYGKYFDRDSSFHSNGNDFDAWHMGQGGFRTDWEPNKRDSLTLQGDLYGGSAGENVKLAVYSPPFSQTFQTDAPLSGANLLGRWKRMFSRASDLSLQWYYDRTNRIEPQAREFRNTFDLELQHRFGWAWRQELTWGLEYRLTSDLLDFPSTYVFDPANRTDHLVTGFVQNQIPLIDDLLRLTFGTKVEHNDYSGWEVEPSGRLAWTPTETQTVWTAVSRAIRTPAQADQDLDITLPNGAPAFVRLVGNPDFQSEKLTAYEWGYRVAPVSSLFVDIAAFYNRYTHLRSGEITPPPSFFVETSPGVPHLIFPVVEGNKFEGETHGLECGTTWNAFDWWRWRLNYSLLLMHLRLEPDSTDGSPRAAVTAGSSPRHQGSLQWSMDLPYHLELDPIARYQESLPTLGTPTYWNLDMRLAWHATHQLELSLVGQNLLQNHHAEADPTQEIQRGFYGQATWHW